MAFIKYKRDATPSSAWLRFHSGKRWIINGARSEMTIGSSTIQFLPLWKILSSGMFCIIKRVSYYSSENRNYGPAKLELVKNMKSYLMVMRVFSKQKISSKMKTVCWWQRQQEELCWVQHLLSWSEVRLQANTCLGSFYAAVATDGKVAREGIYEFVDCNIKKGDRHARNSQTEGGEACLT